MSENKNKSASKEIFIDKIVKLSKMQRILIYCTTIIILFGGFAFLILLPRQSEVSKLTEIQEKTDKKLNIARKKVVKLAGLKKKMEEAKVQFKLVVKALPEKKEIPGLLTSISASGQNSGLEFLVFKPAAEVPKDFYAEIPVDLNISGNFHNVALFFDKISRLSRIVNIKDIKLGSVQPDGKISTLCKAVTYRFVQKKAKVNKKKKNRKKKKR